MPELPHEMTGGIAIPTWRRTLGEQRLEAFVQAHGNVQAQLLFLQLALPGVALAGYSDAAIDGCLEDVKDFERAARNLATVSRQIADEFRMQRRRMEREAQRRRMEREAR